MNFPVVGATRPAKSSNTDWRGDPGQGDQSPKCPASSAEENQHLNWETSVTLNHHV